MSLSRLIGNSYFMCYRICLGSVYYCIPHIMLISKIFILNYAYLANHLCLSCHVYMYIFIRPSI